MRLGPGALVWAGFDGPEVPGPLLDAIRDGKLGGLLLFAYRGNVRSKDQVRSMIAEAVSAAERGGLAPVPVAVDQEGGQVVRIGYRAVFPSAMAIAATGDPSHAERAARAVAEGLRADGINVNHAPVCDLNVEPRNPVIGTRSFGDDAERVAAFVAAWVRGSEAGQVATTPKHFPGHGSTVYDTHHTTVDVATDAETLRRRELVPFRAAFAAGASMAMTAHVRYPSLDPDNIATLSPKITVDLLRREMGFTGLLVTDSLDMQGVQLVAGPERVEALAISAGFDAVMVTTGLERQLEAPERIALGSPATRVLEAIRRSSAFRERYATGIGADIDDGPARSLAAQIAQRSVTHVGPPLPDLRGPVTVVVIPPTTHSPVEELRDPVGTLEEALRRRLGARLRFVRAADAAPGDDGGPAKGPVVVCTFSAFLSAPIAERARRLLARGGVLCALRSPYDASLVPHVPALLTYGDVPVSLDALAAVLAGDAPPRGRLPVRLP